MKQNKKTKILKRVFALAMCLIAVLSCIVIAPAAEIDRSLPLYQITVKNNNSVDSGYLSDFGVSKTQIVYGNSIGVNAIIRPLSSVPLYPDGVYDPVFYVSRSVSVDSGDRTIASYGRDTKQFFVENKALYLLLSHNNQSATIVTRANFDNVLESYFYYNDSRIITSGSYNGMPNFKAYVPYMALSEVGSTTYFIYDIDSSKVSRITANKDVIGYDPMIRIMTSDGLIGYYSLYELLDDNGNFYLEEGKTYRLGVSNYNSSNLDWMDNIEMRLLISNYWNYHYYEILPNTFHFVIRQQDTIQGNLTRLFKLAENGAVSISSPLMDDAWQDGYDLGEDNGYFAGYEVGYNFGFSDGNEEGYELGKDVGYENGYSDAKAVYDTTNAWQNMKSLIFAIFDAPFYVISYSLDFDIFGINIAGTLIALISTALIVWILKIIIVKLF